MPVCDISLGSPFPGPVITVWKAAFESEKASSHWLPPSLIDEYLQYVAFCHISLHEHLLPTEHLCFNTV